MNRLRPLREKRLRRELRGGVVGGGGESGEGPVEVRPGVDFQQLAGTDDGVKDGGILSGVGVADEEPVFESEFGGADLALDGIVIDQDVAVVRLAEEGQLAPAVEAVGDGLAEGALGKDLRVAGCAQQALVQLEDEWHGTLRAESGALLSGHILGVGLDAVEGAKENEKGGGAVISVLQGVDEVAAGVGHARGADDPVTRQGGQGGTVGRVAVGLEHARKILQDRLGGSVATAFVKVEDDDRQLRCEEDPQPGLADRAAAVRIHEIDGGLVHLNVAAPEGLVLEAAVKGKKQLGAVRHPLAHGLAGEGGPHPGEDLLLAVNRDVIAVFSDDDMGDEAGAGLATGDYPRRQGSDYGSHRMGRAGIDRADDLAAEENAGTVVDLVSDLLADDDKRRAVGGRALLEWRLEADGLQDGQLVDPALPALRGAPGLYRDRGGLLGQEVVLADGVQSQLQLVGVHRLGTPTKVLAQERLDLGLHLF